MFRIPKQVCSNLAVWKTVRAIWSFYSSLSLNPQYVSGKQRNIITWETVQVPCHEYTVSYRQSQGKNQYLPDCLLRQSAICWLCTHYWNWDCWGSQRMSPRFSFYHLFSIYFKKKKQAVTEEFFKWLPAPATLWDLMLITDLGVINYHKIYLRLSLSWDSRECG